MTRTFRPLETMSSWRRLAPHVWDRPHDPTVYGVMEVVVDRALPYLEALSREAATPVRVSHLVTKALAMGIRDNPESNGIISNRRIKLRESVDIFVQVAMEGLSWPMARFCRRRRQRRPARMSRMYWSLKRSTAAIRRAFLENC